MGNDMSQCTRRPKPEKYIPDNVQVQAPQISVHQKEILRDSWAVVKNDIAKVGVVTFLRLFEKFPDVQDIFVPFRGLSTDELRANVRLREHGLRVMGTLEKCIARLEKTEKLDMLMTELGQKHVVFNTKVQYFDLIIPQLLHAFQSTLGEKWTPEVENAWSDFLKHLTSIMKQAMII